MRTLLLAALFCCGAPAAFAQDNDCPPEHAAMGHCKPAAATTANDEPLMDFDFFGWANRDASGTSWQPANTPSMAGYHSYKGEWMLMAHATFNFVADHQGGPRGDDKAFAAGMIMLQAERPLKDDGALTLTAMLSPDPLMGKSGYPLLLQAGETANGVSHLIDRQHPHDLFMELSARYDIDVGDQRLYLYGGLPGEPAFGPPTFMHRLSAADSPEAPISHHWLDSTHITFGVLTAGYMPEVIPVKIEASAFRGREPDQNRYDIERPKLDSWAARLSWNPHRFWSTQISYAELTSPEQLDPLEDQKRASASLMYTDYYWSATLAWGSKKPTNGQATNAFLAEVAWKPDRWPGPTRAGPYEGWTWFGRAELVEQNELDPSHKVYQVGKASLGVMREMPVSNHVILGVGGLVTAVSIPSGLRTSYGGQPVSGMAFLRLRLR